MTGPPTPVRDAATVVLVRDGTGGLEVCLLERSTASVFVPGAYVFPGGALDPGDAAHHMMRIAPGAPDDAVASARLGIAAGGLAYWVAAVRECFEEAGVLFATDHAGRPVPFTDPAVDAVFAEHRRALDSGTLALGALCDAAGVHLALGELAYLSRWITPEGPPRRYDTRFFVARAPDEQPVRPDGREVTQAVWLGPDEALERHEAGRLSLIWPTLRTLAVLERFTSADAALAAVRHAETHGALVHEPGGGVRVRLDGDPDDDAVLVGAAGQR